MSILRPVAMAKVGLVGLKDDREALVSVLHDLGVVQVEPLGKEAAGLFEAEHGGESQRAVADELLRFRGLKSALPPVPDGRTRAFPTLGDVLAETRRVPIDEEVRALKVEEDRLLSERKALADTIELLRRFPFYTDRLEYLSGRNLLAFFGEAKPETYARLKTEVPEMSDALFLEEIRPELARFVLAVRTEHADTVSRLAQSRGTTLTAAPRLTGTPAEVLPKLDAERAAIETRLGEIRARLAAIAKDWYPTVAQLEEALAIESRKLEAWTRMGAGTRTFAIEGWAPRRELPALEAAVARASGGRAHLYEIPTRERGPTLMDNPPGIRWYEFFIKFYALPQPDEWDPTLLFALVFPIFFGLMLGDMGYGLVILVISLWMIAGFPGAARLPRALKSVPRSVMSPWGMRSLAFTLVPGCAVAIGIGFVFNEFFGFHVLPFTLFEPRAGPGIAFLLKLAGFIGLALVSIGFALGALKEYFHGHLRPAAGKVAGIAFAWGVGLAGLSLLQHGTGSLVPSGANPVAGVYWALAIGGIVGLFVGEGGQGAMAIMEVVSHILSHTRLVGILLASVIFALVINTVFLANIGSGNVVNVVIAIVILIAGQLFNIVIGVFEPGIQGLRLMFVENFSKYYEGNGRPFRPFGSRRTFTTPVPIPASASPAAPPAPSRA